MRILITGITGMVGSHLADYVLENHPEIEIVGLVRPRSPLDNIRHCLRKIRLVYGDLLDSVSMRRVIRSEMPGWVFHLAAQSFVPYSFLAPASTLDTNILGTLSLLEALREYASEARIHICSSSEVYGQVLEEEVPIKETNPLRPASPYAVSKVGEDMLAYQYGVSYGMHIVRTRAFSHTGPRRGPGFVASSFARQIVLVEKGLLNPPVIKVGNLDSVRTWCDVRDMVRAYWLALEKGQAGEVYNIGGNVAMTVGEVLDILETLATCRVKHEVSPALLRPSDVTLQIPDISKFRALTDWGPEIPFVQTLIDLLDYWGEKIG